MNTILIFEFTDFFHQVLKAHFGHISKFKMGITPRKQSKYANLESMTICWAVSEELWL